MNTRKIHERFWEAMGERFGARWATEYGRTPTLTWIELLDGYTPSDIAAALDRLDARERAHPPTLGEFAVLLRASHRSPEAEDYLRGYWRSVIVAELRRALGEDPAELLNSHPNLAAACRRLLDWACDTERVNGQRTHEMEQRMVREVRAAYDMFCSDPQKRESRLAAAPT